MLQPVLCYSKRMKRYILGIMIIGGMLVPMGSLAQTTPVNIVVEANTTVPAGYAGRREPSSGSPVAFTALLPDTPLTTQATYRYRWEINGQFLESTEQTVALTAPSGEAVRVAVFVEDVSRRRVGQAEEIIRLSTPMVRLYEFNPLYGRATHPLSPQHIMTGREITIAATAFFTSATPESNFVYQWLINNQTVVNPGVDPTQMNLINTGGSGQETVAVQVRNEDLLPQVVGATVNIQY